MAAKYLLPALAVISTVAAANCSISATTTISNPAGATDLASCPTFTGDILLQAGSADAGIVNLAGMKKIVGSLTYENDNTLQTFEAGDLESIGDLTFNNLTLMSSLSMPNLDSVGDLDFTGLGSLATLGFGSPGISSAGIVTIVNTILNSLAGIEDITSISGFVISDNPYLSEITLNVEDIAGTIDIGANDVSNGGQVVAFPNLVSAGELTVRNTTSVSIPSLANVAQNLGFYGNLFQTLSAPNLTYAGGIIFADNSKLTNTSFPLLSAINGTNGTFQIANNTDLSSIAGFPDLAAVTGNVDLAGNFSSVKLPDLKSVGAVGGAMTVSTSATNFDCSTINSFMTQQIVKGLVSCSEGQSNPGSPTSTSSGGGSSTATSGSAAAHLVPILGASTVFGAFLQLFL